MLGPARDESGDFPVATISRLAHQDEVPVCPESTDGIGDGLQTMLVVCEIDKYPDTVLYKKVSAPGVDTGVTAESLQPQGQGLVRCAQH